MTPLVSAVIPTRNRPELVCRAVRSALNQTYTNLEVVVVVDGPDIATVEALEAIYEPRLRIVALKENVGGSEARNIGAREAKGEWIALLDDDDEWLPAKIEKQVAAFIAKDIAFALISCFYSFRSVGKTDVIKPCRLPGANENPAEFAFDSHCSLITSSYLCRRELLLQVPFKKGLPRLQDIDWYLRVVNHTGSDLVVLPEPLAIYNDPSGRATVTRTSQWAFAFEYCKSHKSLMTKRAYERFVVKYCVRLAVRQKAGMQVIWYLVLETFRDGAPKFKTVGLFLLFCVKK